jgi:hypothetical protein
MLDMANRLAWLETSMEQKASRLLLPIFTAACD